MSLPRSREEAVAAVARGERLRFVHFWGHRPSASGEVTASCFSQWWTGHPFTVDGVGYATCEHYMMAAKARLFGDEEHERLILDASTAAEAKALGRKVRGFDEATWVAHRMGVVTEANVAKFGQHDDIGDFLRATAKRVLVEASPRDRIWGIGMGAGNPDADHPGRWRGLNLLGFALMDARDRLS
ncbi:hypothetical protein Afil01_46000 [Actinorhabdospora filicis]|uniref:NADAR domain-containing protein n=1 Tax=Actinorhabdospora filicis TaxID=1785913 RepID=A0A9W6WB70_9ACTN|nr:NADAR family protein [Actinorhabdospora filicis]GLZ79793.1 hypothetical protein Afil01_46000 [Actinorhabdospora filicis]